MTTYTERYRALCEANYEERYDYLRAVCDDIKQYIEDEIDLSDYNSHEDLEEHLNETLWTDDSVTGNASGSYTFNAWWAETYLCHNMELLHDALQEFGCDASYLEKGAEACDVTIRCYLLPEAIHKVVSKIEKE